MRRVSWTLLLSGATALLAAPGGRGDAPSPAAAHFTAEATRLESEIAAAQQAWREQHELDNALLAAAKRLETAFVSPDASPAELRHLEAEYARALDAACSQARSASARRRRVYDEMDRLAAAGRGVEEGRNAVFDAPLPGGVWRIEVAELGVVGLLRLEVDGDLVRGDYRLSNGRRGSVTGTYAAGQLDLVRTDSRGGRDGSLIAGIDELRGSLTGTWQRYDLATGEPTLGIWTGLRLGPDDELPDLDFD